MQTKAIASGSISQSPAVCIQCYRYIKAMVVYSAS